MKSPYLKCGNGSSVSGYLRYIGTRERVELLPDDRPPTRKQEQLITKLVKDFPDSKELDEYSDCKTKPTKSNASAFISRALEENWPAVQQSEGYMKYIATRPRAERLGNHGLFSDEDSVDLAKAMDELDHYTGKEMSCPYGKTKETGRRQPPPEKRRPLGRPGRGGLR